MLPSLLVPDADQGSGRSEELDGKFDGHPQKGEEADVAKAPFQPLGRVSSLHEKKSHKKHGRYDNIKSHVLCFWGAIHAKRRSRGGLKSCSISAGVPGKYPSVVGPFPLPVD